MKLLEGKTALITGCLRGIGRSCLRKFAAEGANIFACAQAETEDFETEIARLQTENHVIIRPLYFDLCNEDEVRVCMKSLLKEHAPINILVNIAGMTGDALFGMMSMETLRKVFEVNLFSQLLITQYVVKLMRRVDGGSIVNISSITALDGNPGQTVYAATKAAWLGVTKTLAQELGDEHIRVNAIAPGVINTEMTKNLPPEFYDRMTKKTPLGRLGEPEEVVDLLMFLSSDQAAYITGQIVRIDGGIG